MLWGCSLTWDKIPGGHGFQVLGVRLLSRKDPGARDGYDTRSDKVIRVGNGKDPAT